ncbi:Uncharacterized conserved protein (DUF2358) [Seminavis robusta]|uniref:Uncharacterized conserved protein (DUF2358) n=1 Tax=Seminavis robusta TaxID=568900 RepID=A0A9N8EGY8_9STRA|nr:Uncharacterized conserved protein (DUF2358) [Seminavis robusta]|eukprot:Sro1081_g239070.1 Uncharacterized conserved protein (DUF2358) (322) ;mRNA; r:15167-16132
MTRLCIRNLGLCWVCLTWLDRSNAFAPAFVATGRFLSVPSPAAALEQETTRIRLPGRVAMVGSVYDSAAVVGGFGVEEEAHHPPGKDPLEPAFSPWEVWCLVRIEQWYSQALSHKCPFLRRRATDFVETLEMLVRDVVIRETNIPLVGPPVSCRGDEKTRHKTKGLSMEELASVIRHDWREDTNKGYYITGRLTPQIYRDDCLFDGPDPDMPVRGLRKFLNAASQLFDLKQSQCELQSLQVQGDAIVAKWTMNGTLRLPWRPKMPRVRGVTTYHLDADGLIKLHEETWDLTAAQAFLKTAWFDFSNMEAHSHYGDEVLERT